MAENDTSQTGTELNQEYMDKKFRTIIDKLDDLEELFDDQQDENWEIIKPVIELFEAMVAMDKEVFSGSKEETVKEMSKELLNKFKRTLEQFNVEIVSAEAGDEYDPELQDMIIQKECPPDQKVGTIHSVITQYSFKYGPNTRKQKVAVYR